MAMLLPVTAIAVVLLVTVWRTSVLVELLRVPYIKISSNSSHACASAVGPVAAPPASGSNNPFETHGYVVSRPDPSEVLWRPLNSSIQPSRLFRDYFLDPVISSATTSSAQDSRHWLTSRNHTVLLLGDSIDRYHLKDFCDLVIEAGYLQAEKKCILPSDSISPPPYISDYARTQVNDTRLDRELFMSRRDDENTRPWLCRVQTAESSYLNLVSLFTYGIDDTGAMFEGHRYYNPPSRYIDRIEAILIPLIRNLEEHYQDSSFTNPSLVQFQSGLWDTRRWSEEDIAARNLTVNATDSSTFMSLFSDLTPERLQKQRTALVDLIQTVSDFFPQAQLIYRTMHYTSEKYMWAPWPRAAQLDALVRSVLDEVGKHDGILRELQGRFRVNDWARLIAGQKNKYIDGAHPQRSPSSILWADTMLYMLKEAFKD